MSKLTIYEPAMCCETGLCGVGVDPELLRISTIENTLKKLGIEVKRYNLSSAPNAFVQTYKSKKYLTKKVLKCYLLLWLMIKLLRNLVILPIRN